MVTAVGTEVHHRRQHFLFVQWTFSKSTSRWARVWVAPRHQTPLHRKCHSTPVVSSIWASSTDQRRTAPKASAIPVPWVVPAHRLRQEHPETSLLIPRTPPYRLSKYPLASSLSKVCFFHFYFVSFFLLSVQWPLSVYHSVTIPLLCLPSLLHYCAILMLFSSSTRQCFDTFHASLLLRFLARFGNTDVMKACREREKKSGSSFAHAAISLWNEESGDWLIQFYARRVCWYDKKKRKKERGVLLSKTDLNIVESGRTYRSFAKWFPLLYVDGIRVDEWEKTFCLLCVHLRSLMILILNGVGDHDTNE